MSTAICKTLCRVTGTGAASFAFEKFPSQNWLRRYGKLRTMRYEIWKRLSIFMPSVVVETLSCRHRWAIFPFFRGRHWFGVGARRKGCSAKRMISLSVWEISCSSMMHVCVCAVCYPNRMAFTRPESAWKFVSKMCKIVRQFFKAHWRRLSMKTARSARSWWQYKQRTATTANRGKSSMIY